jgi:hypothetical protein
MTLQLQSWSELKEVLELAVIDSTATLVRVPYRLPAAAQIDDAQPSHPKKDVAAVIGTTMRQEISAPLSVPFRSCQLAVDATHSFR